MNTTRMRLVGLIAVMSVVSVSGIVLAPHVVHARALARQQSCTDHFKMLGLALHNYHDAHGVFPPGNIWEPEPKRTPHGHGAALAVTPFLEQNAVYGSFNFDFAWTFPQNKTSRDAKLEVFLCPEDAQITETEKADPTGQPTNIAFSLGSIVYCTHRDLDGPKPDGTFFDNSSFGIRDIRDGTSLTVFAAEQLIDRQGRAGSAELNAGDCSGDLLPGKQFSERTGTRWIAGHPSSGYYNARRTPNHPQADCFHGAVPGGVGFLNKVARSRHTGGVNVLFGDGSARFIRDSIKLEVWQALNSRAGGEVIDSDDL